MPDRLTLGDRKLLLVAGAASLVIVMLTVVLGPRDAADVPTTYSAASSGARAAFLLLRASGYSVTRWERSLRDLPDDASATLILAEPQAMPTSEERSALDQFVDRGGRVIVTGLAGAYFLRQHPVSPDPIAGLTWKRVSSRSPSAITRAAPEITLAPRAYWDVEAFALPLYGDDLDAEKVRVVKYDAGRGEAIWWASATPLTNAGLSEPGNLEFFLACVGDPSRAVLWDEYFHGHREAEPASIGDLPFTWLGVQIALAAIAVLLTYSRRSGPVVTPPPENRLSPLEFVRTLGSLYQRARAASVAVDVAYQRFRYRLARRLGMASTASPDDLQRAVQDRWNLDDPAFGDLLRACESARDDPRLTAAAALKLTRSLCDYAVKLDLFKAG
jgi:hypothetical protein